MAYFVGYGYESDECSDDTLTGNCNGFIPRDEWKAGDECVCLCHGEGLSTTADVEQYHASKHRDWQDNAYSNIGYSR